MKEIKIQIPEGYEGIDEEASNLAEGKIVFKKKEETSWRRTKHTVTGYYITSDSDIWEVTKMHDCSNQDTIDRNIFATKKQAKSALAMAQLSQIMQNDPRFGGPIPNQDWKPGTYTKYVILRRDDKLDVDSWTTYHHFLAFRTAEQRDLFLKENEDLIKQYFMLD